MLTLWVNDNDYDKCTNCTNNFSLFIRKHHCRKCGKIFCKKCLNEYLENNQKIVICENCITIENNNYDNIINDYNKIKNELQTTKNILQTFLNKTVINIETQTQTDTKTIETQTHENKQTQHK